MSKLLRLPQDFLRHHAHNVSAIAREHPLEVFWLAVYMLPLLLLSSDKLAQYGMYWLPLLPCWVLLYHIRSRRAAYYAAGLLPALGMAAVYVLGHTDIGETAVLKLLCLNAIALIALLTPFALADNRQFLSRALLTLVNIVSAWLVAGCLMLALLLLQGGLYVLFSLDLNDGLQGKIYYVPLFVLTPLMFLSFERNLRQTAGGEPLLVQNRVIELTLNYIATPALMLYTLMIYVYTGKILLSGSLPDGGVSYVVGSYLAIGLTTQLLQVLSCQPKWQGFHRLFPWLALVPLGLLWCGVIERIHRYGLTEMRLWLLAAAVLLSLYCLLSLRPQWRQYRTFAVLLLGTLLLVGIILPLKRIEAASQEARFERLLAELKLLDGNGRIVQPLPAPTEAQQQQWTELQEQARYLFYVMDSDGERYGAGLKQLAEQHESGSDAELQSVHFRLPAGPFQISGGSIEPVSYAHAEYASETGEITAYVLDPHNERNTRIPAAEIHHHLEQLFARHGLNPQQQYQEEELKVLSSGWRYIPLANDDVLLTEAVEIRYLPPRGYTVTDINVFALFHPAAQSQDAASAPAK